jgi:hypothetical protein
LRRGIDVLPLARAASAGELRARRGSPIRRRLDDFDDSGGAIPASYALYGNANTFSGERALDEDHLTIAITGERAAAGDHRRSNQLELVITICHPGDGTGAGRSAIRIESGLHGTPSLSPTAGLPWSPRRGSRCSRRSTSAALGENVLYQRPNRERRV